MWYQLLTENAYLWQRKPSVDIVPHHFGQPSSIVGWGAHSSLPSFESQNSDPRERICSWGYSRDSSLAVGYCLQPQCFSLVSFSFLDKRSQDTASPPPSSISKLPPWSVVSCSTKSLMSSLVLHSSYSYLNDSSVSFSILKCVLS